MIVRRHPGFGADARINTVELEDGPATLTLTRRQVEHGFQNLDLKLSGNETFSMCPEDGTLELYLKRSTLEAIRNVLRNFDGEEVCMEEQTIPMPVDIDPAYEQARADMWDEE